MCKEELGLDIQVCVYVFMYICVRFFFSVYALFEIQRNIYKSCIIQKIVVDTYRQTPELIYTYIHTYIHTHTHAYIHIQSGEHSSVEDARAALLLYKQVRATWEKECEDAAKKKMKFAKKKPQAKPAESAAA